MDTGSNELNELLVEFGQGPTGYREQKYLCFHCKKFYEVDELLSDTFSECPKCKCKQLGKPVVLKEDWYAYWLIMKNKFKDKWLYHFTDKLNIKNIKQYGGLYSWDFLEKNNIDFNPGSNSRSQNTDSDKGLVDYVRLGLNDNLPMAHRAKAEGRIHNLKWLRIDPIVLLFEGTLFSDINANSYGANYGETIEHLMNIKFDIAQSRKHEESDRPYYQAEVLVKTHIPLMLIKFL